MPRECTRTKEMQDVASDAAVHRTRSVAPHVLTLSPHTARRERAARDVREALTALFVSANPLATLVVIFFSRSSAFALAHPLLFRGCEIACALTLAVMPWRLAPAWRRYRAARGAARELERAA